MSETLLTALQWYGAIASIVAALIVSLNLGIQWTGWGFVIFVTSSLALLAWAYFNPDAEGIAWQNVGLLAINCVGVYRYLFTDKARKEAESAQSGEPS